MTVEHYENFPVASLLLPPKLRPAVKVIYAFARSADDLADEGNAPSDDRLAALASYESELHRIENRDLRKSGLFCALAQVIEEHRLPIQLFRDLLSAFKQDVMVKRYGTFDHLLDYCRRSANPVGSLMLHLYRAADTRNMRDSESICTALQLVNFWQDVAIDWQKERIYLPLQDMAHFGVTEAQLAHSQVDDAWRELMQFEVARTRAMMLAGAPLALRLPGRVGWELRLVVQGGLRILERIEAVGYDVFRHRPQLQKTDWLLLVWRSIRMRSQHKHA